MGEILVKVEGLSKRFCRDLKKSLWYGMQDIGNELKGNPSAASGVLRPDEFWAVKDISFELKRGECLGLIGQNGAGKTTLLRMLNGLIKPDQGRIEMSGKVGALIALGAGFNPILTGRENIYVNAAVLGMKKQYVDRKIDEIIEFAEIGESINSPVQSYSSGMNVRLGFAIAAILIEPDILLLDEVLAVGDIGFAIKCLNTVRQMANQSAVVFVSHSMQQVSNFCSRVIVMHQGEILIDGKHPAEGINRYFDLVKHQHQVSGTGDAEILSVKLRVNEQYIEHPEPTIQHGAKLGFMVQLRLDGSKPGALINVGVMDSAMNPVINMPLHNQEGHPDQFPAGTLTIELSMGTLELSSGKYSLAVAVVDPKSNEMLTYVEGINPFIVTADSVYWSKIVRHTVPEKIEVMK